MQTDPSLQKFGYGLGLVGSIALSFDIPLIRLAQADAFTVMFVRGAGLALILFLFGHFVFKDRISAWAMLTDRDFVTVGALSGLNNIFFTMAVFNTSAANVVFILAFNAMLAAAISWPMTGERPSIATLAAIFATLIGVGIIVSDGLVSGNFFGDVMALVCAILLAFSLTLTRKSGKNLALAPGFGGLVSASFALPLVLWQMKMPAAPFWLYLDAFVMVPLAGITLWLAPKYIPAPNVAMFYLLETVLAPIWIWFVFYETPSLNVFIGGSIVVAALSCHGLWELNRRRILGRPAKLQAKTG